jgi:hypothetical protein
MKEMKITNEYKTKVIELFVVETERLHYPSFRLKIAVKTEEFEGQFDRNIWITASDLDDFVGKLTKLDETRNGYAELHSMSPEEFKIGFKNLDTLGHMAVVFELQQRSSPHNSYQDHLKFEFEIDPSILPHIINDFITLGA